MGGFNLVALNFDFALLNINVLGCMRLQNIINNLAIQVFTIFLKILHPT